MKKVYTLFNGEEREVDEECEKALAEKRQEEHQKTYHQGAGCPLGYILNLLPVK